MEPGMETRSRNLHTHHTSHSVVHEMHEMHGKSPNAAMHSSLHRHAGHSVAMFRDKFWLSLALTIQVVLWSSEYNTGWARVPPSFRDRDGSLPFWVQLFFSTAEVFSFAVPGEVI